MLVFLPNLTLLDVARCDELSEESLIRVVEHCGGLQYLDVSWCRVFLVVFCCSDDARLARGLCSSSWSSSSSSPLTAFLFPDPAVHPQITDDFCFAVSASCPSMQDILLEGCKPITPQGLLKMAKGCRMLRKCVTCFQPRERRRQPENSLHTYPHCSSDHCMLLTNLSSAENSLCVCLLPPPRPPAESFSRGITMCKTRILWKRWNCSRG